MNQKDYYLILGVNRTASEKEIKTAYRKLALKFHPDKNSNDPFFTQMFRDVQEAYDTLSNPILKIKYDKSEPKAYREPSKKPTTEPTEQAQGNRNAKKTTPEDWLTNVNNRLEVYRKETRFLATTEVRVSVVTNFINSIVKPEFHWIYKQSTKETRVTFIKNFGALSGLIPKDSLHKIEIQIVSLLDSDTNELKLLQTLIEKSERRQKRINVIKWIWNNLSKLVWGGIIISMMLLLLFNHDRPSKPKPKRESFEEKLQRKFKAENERLELDMPKIKPLEIKPLKYKKLPKLISSKWIFNHLETGESPYDNYFGVGLYDKKFHNSVNIKNGQKSDVIVCLTQYFKPFRVIRNEYIRAGESFEMKNIPDGKYYIKSFYGTAWNPDTVVFGSIKGFFDNNSGFSKSDKLSDLIELEQNNIGNQIEYSTVTITLYPVQNGNMETVPIKAESFFNN